MPVEITSTAPNVTPALEEHLARAADLLLQVLQQEASELEVSLVGDQEIAELNFEYRGKKGPTDVLSFPQLEGEEMVDGEEAVHLGDLVISVDTAARQAEEGGWTVEEETARLLLHGLLHLLGFDHEDGGEEQVRMKAEENRLAEVLGAAGIGCAHEQTGASR
jgi:rRNA maturation RNase YbeY